MSPTHPRLVEAATWSVHVRDADSGEVVFEHGSGRVLSSASVPKLLLLVACAQLIETGALDPAERLGRASVAPVGDSGLWQHLDQQTLTVADAAALVGAASDNLATNVLLQRLGLDVVARECAQLGIRDVLLHDLVRDARGPGDPPQLSSASAVGLVDLVSRLATATLCSPAVSSRVTGWMRHALDLSMVASAFGQDPLAHGAEPHGVELFGAEPHGVELFTKTGTDEGVRADAGWVRTPHRAIAYAAIANWSPAPGVQDAVLASMRAIGEHVRDAAAAG